MSDLVWSRLWILVLGEVRSGVCVFKGHSCEELAAGVG
jgi:hypothetical protein